MRKISRLPMIKKHASKSYPSVIPAERDEYRKGVFYPGFQNMLK